MKTLPLPDHYRAAAVGEVWRVPYQERAVAAEAWRARHSIQPAARDSFKIALVLIDVQNTFCIPGFELYVAGASGTGAVDDNRRLCEFIYRNMDGLSRICVTLDTHQAVQIFHSIFLINDKGEHPAPYTLISVEDIEAHRWRFNPLVADSLQLDPSAVQAYLRHYVNRLKATGKYELAIWPYHAMLGGIGHALVPALEEAVFFHSIARYSQADFQVKGNHPLSENYSVLNPEVREGPDGRELSPKQTRLIEDLVQFDAVIVAGQAKSHCVAWTVEDLLSEIHQRDGRLSRKIYLLEDCTSPVVIPGVIDYSDQADAAFGRFADAGMHIVRSTVPLSEWPGMEKVQPTCPDRPF